MLSSSCAGRTTLKQAWALSCSALPGAQETASHFLALMEDPVGGGKTLRSCTADVLGKILLHNVYLPEQRWEQKATGGEGRCSSSSGSPLVDLPFRAWMPGRHSGVQRHFSVSAAMPGPGTAASQLSGAGFTVPQAPGWDPLPPKGWCGNNKE